MTGEAYRDPLGRAVPLGAEIGAGGEGSVFEVRHRPRLCAKIYRPEHASTRAEKIEAMLARRPPWRLRRALAWPVEPLYEGTTRPSFAGFLMPARRGMVELFRLVVPDERMQVAGWLTQRDLCLVAARLAAVVARIHRAGHCAGDLKPQNVLCAPRSGRVALVDNDSFQIAGPAGAMHRSTVVTPEYTAPELAGADPARVDRTPASDVFALAVLVHQLLLGGAHPFDGELAQGAGSVERIPGRIRRGMCPIVPGVAAVRPAAGALPFATLPAALRALFVRCFGPGHDAPGARPAAAEWQEALLAASRAMVRCARSEAHLHDRALARCPFCERRERSGIDLFPARQGWQRALGRVPEPGAAPEADRARWLAEHVRGRLTAGKVTAAERAWLGKAGSALGFDRARVARAIEEEAARGGPVAVLAVRFAAWRAGLAALAARLAAFVAVGARLAALATRLPPRRRLLLPAVSISAGGACVAALLTTSQPRAGPRATDEQRGRVCAVLARRATIGNTRGKGAFLRAAPSTSSGKVPLPEGTVVRLTGRTRTVDDLAWSEVELPPLGRVGWVVTKYLVGPS